MRSSRTGRVPEPRHRSTAASPAVGPRAAGITVIATLAAVAAGCDGESGRNPLEPTPEGDTDASAAVITCEADVPAGTLACAPAPGTSDSAVEVVANAAGEPDATTPGPLAGDLTLGGQGTLVGLASSDEDYDAGTNIFSADVTVENLIGQALATEDGENGHADGVRVFFHTGPVVTATDDDDAGTAEVNNEDGAAAFTSGDDQPYFQYGGTLEGGGTGDELGDDGILEPDEESDPKTWEWQLSSNVETFEFTVYVHGAIRYEDGWIDIAPAADTLVAGDPDDGTVTLDATPRDVLGDPVPAADEITWSSSDEDVATVDEETGEVAAVAPGTVTVSATDGALSGTAEIVVTQGLTDDTYPQTVIGNVGVSSTRIPYSVTDNDALEDGTSVDFAGWDGAAGETEEGGAVTMTMSGGDMGEFDYGPPTGFEGADRFSYVIGDDTATVSLTVEDMIWFVDSRTGACSADCDGRLSNPFTSLADFGGVNDGAVGHPGDGHAVFVYESSSHYPGPVTLRDGQTLVGQDATATLAEITGIAPPSGSEPFPTTDAANTLTVTIVGGSGGVALGSGGTVFTSGVTVRGFSVETTGGTGIAGADFGTLTLAPPAEPDLVLDVSGGPALDLSNGEFSGAFLEVSSDGGANGITLSNTTGTFQVLGEDGAAGSGGVIQNATGDGISLTNTGPVSLAWMTIQNNAGNGLGGDGVDGFTLRRSTVTGNGDAAGENGLDFSGLTGTARLDTVTVTDSYETNVAVANDAGTLDFQLRGGTIGNTGTPGPDTGEGVLLEPSGTATIDVTAIDNTFSNQRLDAFSYDPTDGAGGDIELAENVVTGSEADGLVIRPFSTVDVWSGTITYDVRDNELVGADLSQAIAVEVLHSTSSANMAGTIRDNTIGDAGTTDYSCGGVGIAVSGEGDGTHTTAVTGNVMRRCDGEGVEAHVGNGDATFNLTIRGNDIRDINLNEGFFGFFGLAGGDAPTICLAFGHPTDASLQNVLDHGTNFDDHFFIDQTAGDPTLLIEGFGGGNAVDAEDFLNDSNVDADGGAVAGFIVLDDEDVSGAPTSCPTP